MMKRFAIIPLLYTKYCFAEQLTYNTAISSSKIFEVFFVLAGIIFLIFVFAFLLKKTTGFSKGHQGSIKILATTLLGHKEKVVLIQVGEQQFLIGATPNNINTLHAFEHAVSQGTAPIEPGINFRDQLKNFLGKQ